MADTPFFTKDPQSVRWFSVNWEADLAEGDSIETSTWTIPGALAAVDTVQSSTAALILVAGGIAGSRYGLLNQIVTANGEIDHWTIYLDIRPQ